MFASIGENCRISSKAVFYSPERIHIGDNVRIDDFCLLSAGDGGIEIGSFVHIGCFAYMVGAGKITMKDYSSLSGRCAIYSSTDDFSGEHMINPTVPSEFLGVKHGPVTIGKHAVIGCGSILMIGVTVGDGAAVGAMSFVKRSIPEFEIWAGNPAVKVGNRKRVFLEMEKEHRISDHQRFINAVEEYTL